VSKIHSNGDIENRPLVLLLANRVARLATLKVASEGKC